MLVCMWEVNSHQGVSATLSTPWSNNMLTCRGNSISNSTDKDGALEVRVSCFAVYLILSSAEIRCSLYSTDFTFTFKFSFPVNHYPLQQMENTYAVECCLVWHKIDYFFRRELPRVMPTLVKTFLNQTAPSGVFTTESSFLGLFGLRRGCP